MALIIEDGSGVAGAQSFVTAAELVAFAELRGLTYPATETEQEQLLVLAADYLLSRESDLKGERTDPDQALIYPRKGVDIRGVALADDVIPSDLRGAQMEAALAQQMMDILSNQQIQNVASEKVDVLEISYFSGGKASSVSLGRVNTYLYPLLKTSASGSRLERI